MVAELATATAQTLASSLIGSAAGSAAEKGVQSTDAVAKQEKQPADAQVGLKATEILVSSLMTAIAVSTFSRISRDLKGIHFVGLAAVLSVIASIASAYLKVRL